jgi:hypothetical protein
MAYEDNQNDFPLPGGKKSPKQGAEFLPKYFRTNTNRKFLDATIDQFNSDGVAEKIDAFVGKREAKAVDINDNYLDEISSLRKNYQFDPVSVYRDEIGNITYSKDYVDYLGLVKSYRGSTANQSLLNSQEFYAWNPRFDFDKFVNFREYYWLPNGPQEVAVQGQARDIVSTYTVTTVVDDNNTALVFTPDGTTRNPRLKLYRGQTYRFEVSTDGDPISIAVNRSVKPAPREQATSLTNNTLYTDGVTIQQTEVENTLEDVNQFVNQGFVENGILEFAIPDNAPDTLYFVSQFDLNVSCSIEIANIEENTVIDVDNEIIGKKTYTTSQGWSFSNGMKVYFQGRVSPQKYKEGLFYVEGVGEAIKLVPVNNLEVPAIFTQDTKVPFDDNGFDRVPFSDALSFAGTKDYIVINRSSADRNSWSRYNRWFHVDVINKSAEINNQPVEIDQNFRAKRPIIEFEAGLKLYNHGTIAKDNIDLVDTFCNDVFSKIEGSSDYYVDGIKIADGMRILFLGDDDPFVYGKIFEVKLFTFKNNQQISLVETADTDPVENQTVLVKLGNDNTGNMFWYNGIEWNPAQDKNKLNQPPLFDLFDADGQSLADNTIYTNTEFKGNKIFSYKVGEGLNDPELGFPLVYKNIQNTGDITFEFNLLNELYTYEELNQSAEIRSDNAFAKRYDKFGDLFEFVNGWTKANKKSVQYVIRQFFGNESVNNFPIDVYDNSADISDLKVVVYVDNQLQKPNEDYTFFNINNQKRISFKEDINQNSIVLIKTLSDTPKNQNGYYEVPHNFERNPLNDNIVEFTLGQVNDHVGSIVIEADAFEGSQPGNNNLRDIGPIAQFGRKFVQHSGPLNLALYHLANKDSNAINSIKFARNEYAKFKRVFLQTAETLGFDGPVKKHVDLILETINKDKTSNMPFFSTDMIGIGAAKKLEYTVLDNRNKFYALSTPFDLQELSNKAVSVYVNSVQLVFEKDYVFTSAGFVNVLADLDNNDTIEIYEYETTEGCFIPPTPSSLGIYPKYIPEKYFDSTYKEPTDVIRGHDGSITVAYGDFRDDLMLELEKRIFNNIKVEYDPDIFDINDYVGGDFRNTKISKAQLDNITIGDFVEWSKKAGDPDYTDNDFLVQTESFTYNYSNSIGPNGKALPGFWRAVYKQAYDTDSPHTRPWEMLGFTIKPGWWEQQYGPAPYTSDNLILWKDIENGIINEPGKQPRRLKKYIRPGLTQHLPVDQSGNLISPLDSSYAQEFSYITQRDLQYDFGDQAPVESAWRRSSEYPFSLLSALMILRPADVIGKIFDRSRIARGINSDLLYTDTGKRIKLSDLSFPATVVDNENILTSGIVNYIQNYMTSNVKTNYANYIEDLPKLDHQLGFKLAGFTDKSKLNLVLDSRTPSNKGNIFVPKENYNVILTTSSVQDVVRYSGIIIEKIGKGYRVKGYDNEDTYFDYFKPISADSDPSINVGGISESFIEWGENRNYVTGKIVRFQKNFYRVVTTHTSSDTFDLENFRLLSELPVAGGATATIKKNFESVPSRVNYGKVYTDIQQVVDFIIGYGEYLKSIGFEFEFFNRTTEAIENFQQAVREFLFWTTQNWAAGTVITISPGANECKFSRDFYTVQDIYNGFYDYNILKSDGNTLKTDFTNTVRENGNQFSIVPINTEDGIYFAKFALVQTEHSVLIDNTTVFNDTIYDPEPGYRQERIRIIGYRTTDWNGTLNIPGFIYDDAKVTEWTPWQDYRIGDLVKYKEFYYSADKDISGSNTFDASNWNRLSEKPESTLKPNWDYRAKQFTDFYDLDTDNFDSEQQKLAQHLIGYQKRNYLSNIITDDVSQYKFYQGFIQDKGTNNALTKLFDKLGSANKDSLEFFEEWAVRKGQYGATDQFDEVEYVLDEKLFRIEPQLVELVNSVDNTRTDLVHQYPLKDVYVKPKDYDHKPFPVTYSDKNFSKTGGYLKLDQVNFIAKTIDDILALDIQFVEIGNIIWVPQFKNSWDVFEHIETDKKIVSIERTDTGFTAFFDKNINFLSGSIIGIENIDSEINGFHIVKNSTLNSIDVDLNRPLSSESYDFEDSTLGFVSEIASKRVANADQMNLLVNDLGLTPGEKIWVDNINNRFAVLQNSKIYKQQQEIENPDTGDGLFGIGIDTNASNNTMAVGRPYDNKVYVYNRVSDSQDYALTQTIDPQFIKTIDVNGVTLDNPTVLQTSVSHELSDSDQISITGIVGTTELNENTYFVKTTSLENQVELYEDFELTKPVDSTGFTAYVKGGNVTHGSSFNITSNFGTAVEITDDGNYLVVGAPAASNVKTRYIGLLEDVRGNISAGDIVNDRGTLWQAQVDSPADGSTIDYELEDWKQVYNIPVDSAGSASGLKDQGLVQVYEKKVNNRFELLNSFVSVSPSQDEKFGIEIKSSIDAALDNKLYIKSKKHGGRIYLFEKINTEFGSAADPLYRGTFNPNFKYEQNEIVYYEGLLYSAITTVPKNTGFRGSVDWNQIDLNFDRVGYLPYLSDVVEGDSDSSGFTNSTNIADIFDVSRDTNTLVISSFDTVQSITKLAIYKINNGRYQFQETIDSSGDLWNTGLAVDSTGANIAVGDVYNDDNGIDTGRVLIYTYDAAQQTYNLDQTLYPPRGLKNELFGYKVEFNLNDRLAILSINGKAEQNVNFDNGTTFFDNSTTEFKKVLKKQNQIYVFEKLSDKYIIGEIADYASYSVDINGTRTLRNLGNTYKPTLIFKNNHITLSLPSVNYTNDKKGLIFDLRSDRNVSNWKAIGTAKDHVDYDLMKTAFLYDRPTNDLITYLDVIDPIKGKIANPAEQEISYKLYYDPAVYNVGSTNTGTVNPWDSAAVGKLWWDLSASKWFNPYQGNIEYSANNWNKLIPGFDVEVYEWVESDIPPSEWDQLADTTAGVVDGISGQSKYGDSQYSRADVYDPISDTFSSKYYFWVKDKQTIPAINNRQLASSEVTSLIKDPAGTGYRFVAVFGNDQYAVYNCRSLIKDKDTVIHFEYYNTVDNDKNIHTEYELLSEGLETSMPNEYVVNKWIDSLVGYDQERNQLPDLNLSPARRYGILNDPNQSMFVNNNEALKQIVERVNRVLERNLIVDDFDLSPLTKIDPQPSSVSRKYDVKIETESQLRFVGTAKISRAVLEPVIQDGKIVDIKIVKSGRGYVDPSYDSKNDTFRKGPRVNITGTGKNAVIETEINNLGQVINATVKNSGFDYDDNTIVSVRKFSVLVENDSEISGFWSLYNFNDITNEWFRIDNQDYDTNLYWQYKDWYADGFDNLTPIDYLITASYEIDSLNNRIGDVVKIENIGSGGWLLLQKIDEQPQVDYTVNYKTIGRQNGTIQFSKLLYNNITSGFDNQDYDSLLYDREAIEETRIILKALRDNIFVDQLAVEYNRLFFSSVRYALSEQPSVDWIFKTSFIKAKHNVGELEQKVTFKNDNLENYQDYVDEVKPYKTKVREYVSSYEKVDPTNTTVTDFDLPPRYDEIAKRIVTEDVKAVNSQITGVNDFVKTPPQKSWLDNVGFEIKDIVISNGGTGWSSGPLVTISGGGGPTLTGRATIARGSVNSIDVDTSNATYISAPMVTFDGSQAEDSKPAKANVILGYSKTRSSHVTVKFDRITGNYLFTKLDETDTFVGSGSQQEFVLEYPADTNRDTFTVFIDNVEMLSSEFVIDNIVDNTKTYQRKLGRITFETAPALNAEIIINYKKSVEMLSAADRINFFYNPTTGMAGNDLAQLMDGIDYGGVQVDSIDFGNEQGFESSAYGTTSFDTFDQVFDDQIFVLDGSTQTLELKAPLEAGVVYNLYKNNVRLDDPNFDGSSAVTNDNAVINSIIGDGITNTIDIDEEAIPTQDGDVIVIRKSTSDGSFLPSGAALDTELTGGNFQYSTAKGIDSGEIVVDGDGFVTETTSKGPEELVPGQVADTMDMQVYHKVPDGQGLITVQNYITDGNTSVYSFEDYPMTTDTTIVKIDNRVLHADEYEIDFENKTVIFDSVPDADKILSILTIGVNGTSIVDADFLNGDGSTENFVLGVNYQEPISAFVTINGIQTESFVLEKADSSYGIKENRLIINFDNAPDNGSVINYTIYSAESQTYSQMIIDQTFNQDGINKAHEFDTESNPTPYPFNEKPIARYILVKDGNRFLNPGYAVKYTMTTSSQYDVQAWQFDNPAELMTDDIVVHINGEQLDSSRYSYDSVNYRVILNKQEDISPGSELIVNVIKDAEYTTVDTELEIELANGVEWPIEPVDEFLITADDGTEIPVVLQEYEQTGNIVKLILQGYVREIFKLLYASDTTTVFYNNDSTTFTVKSFDVVKSERLNLRNNDYTDIKIYVFGNHDVNDFERQTLTVINDPTTPLVDAEQIQIRNNLTRGVVNLRKPAAGAEYVWVMLNGTLLTAGADYKLVGKTQLDIKQELQEQDIVDILHFTAPAARSKYAFRIFKDIINRFHYKRLSDKNSYTLSKDLKYYDNIIELEDATGIDEPNRLQGIPGVVWIGKERIEYFVKQGNLLRQLRRGTLGTGIKTVHLSGETVLGQGASENIPYKDQIINDIKIGDGSSADYILDYTPDSTKEIEVFVGGRRLRDHELPVYNANLSLDSPEADTVSPAEYSVENNIITFNIQDELHSNQVPLSNEKIQIVRKIGKIWNDKGKSLSDSENQIAKFLTSSSIQLPR